MNKNDMLHLRLIICVVNVTLAVYFHQYLIKFNLLKSSRKEICLNCILWGNNLQCT